MILITLNKNQRQGLNITIKRFLGLLHMIMMKKLYRQRNYLKGGADSSIIDLKVIAKSLLRLEDLKEVAIFHNHQVEIQFPVEKIYLWQERYLRFVKHWEQNYRIEPMIGLIYLIQIFTKH